MNKKLYIEGMSCGHCANHVKNALIEVAGASSVEVDVEGKFAMAGFPGDVEESKLKEAVEEEAGYTLVKVESL